MPFQRILLGIALPSLVVLSACGVSSVTHSTQTPPPPTNTVNMEVVLFPGQQDGADSAAIQQYLMDNTQVTLGATLVVQWSAVDQDGNPANYDWSFVDSQILPWKNAEKKVNLVVWANSDGSGPTCGTEGKFGTSGIGNCAVPAYIWAALGPPNYVTCSPGNSNGPQQMPNYMDSNHVFMTHYQNFIAALVSKYGSDASIGYMRIGLGRGGETIPVADWGNTSEPCGTAYVNTWNYTVSSWDNNYLQPMLQYEGSLKSPKQLMVGITSMGGNSGSRNADFAAQVAVPLGIGIGSQGLQQADLSNPPASCSSDWCGLFAKYPNVPHELQPIGLSCPDSSCPTGSLATILPFAVANHVTIIELYYTDWLAGFDPNFPGYTPAYTTAIENAAMGK